MKAGLILVGCLAVACGPKMDPKSTYNATTNIIDTAHAGKAAADKCSQGQTALCPMAGQAFDSIAEVAEAIRKNAKEAGGQ